MPRGKWGWLVVGVVAGWLIANYMKGRSRASA